MSYDEHTAEELALMIGEATLNGDELTFRTGKGGFFTIKMNKFWRKAIEKGRIKII